MQQQAKGRVLRIVIGQHLVDHLDIERQRGSPGIIGRLAQRRAQNLQRIETNQLLPRADRVICRHVRHRLERAAEAFSRLRCRLRDTLSPAALAGKEGDNQVSLMHRPGAQNDGFVAKEHDHEAYSSSDRKK